MNIGKPIREAEYWPLTVPIPTKKEEPTPIKVDPKPKKEPVPAGR